MIRKEIPLKDFITDDMYKLVPGLSMLEELGFDTTRGELSWWDDPEKNVRVIIQTFPEDRRSGVYTFSEVADKPFDYKKIEAKAKAEVNRRMAIILVVLVSLVSILTMLATVFAAHH